MSPGAAGGSDDGSLDGAGTSAGPSGAGTEPLTPKCPSELLKTLVGQGHNPWPARLPDAVRAL